MRNLIAVIRFRSLGIAAIAVACAFAFPSASVAQPLHHWRFEPDDYLVDSVTGIRLELPPADQDGVPVADFPLTSIGRGQFFPPYFGSAPNMGAVDLVRDSAGLISSESTPVTGDFTIELLTNIDELAVDGPTLGADLAGQITEVGARNRMSWSIKVWMNSDNVQRQTLAFVLSDGSSPLDFPASHIHVDEEKDYYIAGAFELEEKLVTYYAFDLANRSLEISPAPHALETLNGDPTMTIGGDSCRCFFTDGVIDEVRLSKNAVALGDLLLSEAGLTPDEILLHPRSLTLRRERDGRTFDRESVDGSSLLYSDELVSKFELPDIDTDQLESAELQFEVDVPRTDLAQLELLGSLTDDALDMSLGDGYDLLEKTEVTLSPQGSTNVAFDVTEMLRANSRLADDAILAFRLNNLAGRTNVGQPRLNLQFLSDGHSLPGDIDENGVVDFADFLRLSTNFGLVGGQEDGDLDQSGTVDFADFLILSGNFGKTLARTAAVPEPCGFVLALLVLPGHFCRRSSRRSACFRDLTQ